MSEEKKTVQQQWDETLEGLAKYFLGKLGRDDITHSSVGIGRSADGGVSLSVGFKDLAREEYENANHPTPLEQRLRTAAEKNGFTHYSYLDSGGSGRKHTNWKGLHVDGTLEESGEHTLKDELGDDLDDLALDLLSQIKGYDIPYSSVGVYKNPIDGVSLKITFGTLVREKAAWQFAKMTPLEKQVSDIAKKLGFDFSVMHESYMGDEYTDWTSLVLGTAMH